MTSSVLESGAATHVSFRDTVASVLQLEELRAWADSSFAPIFRHVGMLGTLAAARHTERDFAPPHAQFVDITTSACCVLVTVICETIMLDGRASVLAVDSLGFPVILRLPVERNTDRKQWEVRRLLARALVPRLKSERGLLKSLCENCTDKPDANTLYHVL